MSDREEPIPASTQALQLLHRIADALERLSPPLTPHGLPRKLDEQDITHVTPEMRRQWHREDEDEARQKDLPQG